jgi:hypothetical protein
MVLAADVRDRSGRLLLKKGTSLNERHLYILHTWCTAEADVANADEAQDSPACIGTIDPALWDSIEIEIAPFFSHTDLSHPAMKELLRIRIVREAHCVDR